MFILSECLLYLSSLQAVITVYDFSHCVDHLRSSLSGELTKSQTCIIPQDCELSQWTQWMPYNSSCIEKDGRLRQGYMIRTRSIIKISLGTGRPCQSLEMYIALKAADEKPCIRYVDAK